MRGRIIAVVLFAVAAIGLLHLDSQGFLKFQLSDSHSLLRFLAISCILLGCQQLVSIIIVVLVGRYRGPEGEVKMLINFLHIVTVMLVFVAFLFCIGVLSKVGAVAAGFAGMLLGWSLQAPVSGLAAWLLVTLKRPFRIGDRVLFSSLGLIGDVKQVGLMYTVLDQVGGAVGSEEAIGRDILIPNAMLFNQVAVNYTPKQQAAYFLDEVVIRITYDSDWDAAEKIMLDAACEVTANVIEATGEKPYIRSDIWDYGILMRLRYLTMAKERPRITHEIVKYIFKEVQVNPKVDIAIPFVYSFRKSTDGVMRDHLPQPNMPIQELPISVIDPVGIDEADIASEEELHKLTHNIQSNGLLQPIVVVPTENGRYRIVAGPKRFIACRRLGWKTIPVVITKKEIVPDILKQDQHVPIPPHP
jgi:small-conductance mechanosensitive channel